MDEGGGRLVQQVSEGGWGGGGRACGSAQHALNACRLLSYDDDVLEAKGWAAYQQLLEEVLEYKVSPDLTCPAALLCCALLCWS